MRRPRFTIRSLLLFTSFVAVAVAPLRAATDVWDGGVFGIATLILLTAVLLAVHRTERRRAYWLGFALFGSTYLVASLVPPVESRLPTAKGLAYLDSKVPGRQRSLTLTVDLLGPGGSNAVQPVASSPQGGTLATSLPGTVRLVRVWDTWSGKMLAGPDGTTENFVRIGHSFMALLLAFLGGHLSRILSDAGRRQQASDQAGTTPSDTVSPRVPPESSDDLRRGCGPERCRPGSS